jgi:hypothetical protein
MKGLASQALALAHFSMKFLPFSCGANTCHAFPLGWETGAHWVFVEFSVYSCLPHVSERLLISRYRYSATLKEKHVLIF